jgi:hypothetical protein
LFAQQSRHPRLPSLRVPRHEHVPPPDGKRQWTSVVGVPEKKKTSRLERRRDLVAIREQADIAGHGGGTIPRQHIVGSRLQYLAAPSDRYSQFTPPE